MVSTAYVRMLAGKLVEHNYTIQSTKCKQIFNLFSMELVNITQQKAKCLQNFVVFLFVFFGKQLGH